MNDYSDIPNEAMESQFDGEEMFRAFFNANSDDYMAYWDSDLTLRLANFYLSEEYLPLIRMVRDNKEPTRFEAILDDRAFDVGVYPAINSSGVCKGVAVFAHDISKRKEAEEKLHHLAFYDPLTGLPNRTLLNDRLSQAVNLAERHAHFGAVMFIDLDRFKNINDSLGHHAGDDVLKESAERMEFCRRDEDTVARMGGDEFVWVLPELADNATHAAEAAYRAADRLQDYFRARFVLDGHELRVTPSIGITIFGEKRETPQELMKQADAAMHRAKKAATAVALYRPQLQEAAYERLKIEAKLHAAVRNRMLEVHLQPQASCDTNRMISCEALVRWNDPELGNISPAKFVPIAEETGLILEIGDFVLDRVCRQIHHWDRTPGAPQLDRIAVNISPVQFRQRNFVERIQNHMERWQVSPERLELELTEGLLIEQIDVAIEKMRALRQLGVRFAIDDFGTGYSSLAYLNKLPLDILKIDQSFVRNMLEENSSKAIVTSIITMAKLLGFELVAEGVETEEQLAYLREQGCETYQGYLFGKPVPAHEIADVGANFSKSAIA